MKIQSTAYIEISSDNLKNVNLSKLKNRLDEVLEIAANRVLAEFEINNEEIYTVILDGFELED